MFVCTACTYPSRLPDRCDNPACAENPSVSEAQKHRWRAAAEKRAAEDRAFAEKQRLRKSLRRRGHVAAF